MKWIVYIRVWFDNRYDCMSAEYSGIRHDTEEAAIAEMKAAESTVLDKLGYVEMYIRKGA